MAARRDGQTDEKTKKVKEEAEMLKDKSKRKKTVKSYRNDFTVFDSLWSQHRVINSEREIPDYCVCVFL